MKLYLAGPMRGIPEFNAPAFREGARKLRELGHEVFSPLERDQDEGYDWSGHSGDLSKAIGDGFSLHAALKADIDWICTHADGVVTLPGWRNSLGASAEVAVARALGLYTEELETAASYPPGHLDFIFKGRV